MTRCSPMVRWIGTVLVGALAACGGTAGDEADDSSTNPEGTTTESRCAEGRLNERTYILCAADAPDDAEDGDDANGDVGGQDLVVALHGRGSSAADMQAATQLDRDAAEHGMAVVYPEALDGGWGDDTFTTPNRPSGDEDVTFLDALVASLRSDARIGAGPVGIVGFSNGASMALRYAAARPGDVGAVVSVSGQLPRDDAIRPAGRVPLLEIYGTADPIRPYDTGIPDAPARQPGAPTPTLPTRATVAAFVGVADHDGLTETNPDPDDGTSVRTERWADADGTLAVLHTIVGGGHTWPSAHAPFMGSQTFGPVSHDLDASAEAVAFVLEPGS